MSETVKDVLKYLPVFFLFFFLQCSYCKLYLPHPLEKANERIETYLVHYVLNCHTKIQLLLFSSEIIKIRYYAALKW